MDAVRENSMWKFFTVNFGFTLNKQKKRTFFCGFHFMFHLKEAHFVNEAIYFCSEDQLVSGRTIVVFFSLGRKIGVFVFFAHFLG